MKEEYYISIKEKLLKSEIYDKARDYAKDRNKVKVYYETGELLSKAGKHYGKNIIKQYSEKLMIEVGKKYNERTLYGMRKFYEIFNEIKLNPMGSKLSWSHFRELLVLKNADEIKYYINISEQNNLTRRELNEKIKSKEYNRLSDEYKNKIIESKCINISDTVPNPILVKDNKKYDKFGEYALKELILNNLDDFLSQLGYGFSYVGNEYRIKYNNRYNYIDLLLFNIEYNCYVVIELKVCELKKEHIGQIEIYMNYIDKNLKKEFQNKTIGIIICKKNNQYVIDYCSDKRIFSREYELA